MLWHFNLETELLYIHIAYVENLNFTVNYLFNKILTLLIPIKIILLKILFYYQKLIYEFGFFLTI